jgi:hypothetical protein
MISQHTIFRMTATSVIPLSTFVTLLRPLVLFIFPKACVHKPRLHLQRVIQNLTGCIETSAATYIVQKAGSLSTIDALPTVEDQMKSVA